MTKEEKINKIHDAVELIDILADSYEISLRVDNYAFGFVRMASERELIDQSGAMEPGDN